MIFFFSENYIVHWSKDGVPKDIEMLNNFRVVFTVSTVSVEFKLPPSAGQKEFII